MGSIGSRYEAEERYRGEVGFLLNLPALEVERGFPLSDVVDEKRNTCFTHQITSKPVHTRDTQNTDAATGQESKEDAPVGVV